MDRGTPKDMKPLFTREYWEYVMRLFEERKKEKFIQETIVHRFY